MYPSFHHCLYIDEHWEDTEDIDYIMVDTVPEQPKPADDVLSEHLQQAAALTTWIILFLLRMQGRYYISDMSVP